MQTLYQSTASSPLERDFVNAKFLHDGMIKPIACGSTVGAVTAHTLQDGALGIGLSSKEAIMAGLGTGGTTALLCAVLALGTQLRRSGVEHDQTQNDNFAFEHEKQTVRLSGLRELEPYAARHRLH